MMALGRGDRGNELQVVLFRLRLADYKAPTVLLSGDEASTSIVRLQSAHSDQAQAQRALTAHGPSGKPYHESRGGTESVWNDGGRDCLPGVVLLGALAPVVYAINRSTCHYRFTFPLLTKPSPHQTSWQLDVNPVLDHQDPHQAPALTVPYTVVIHAVDSSRFPQEFQGSPPHVEVRRLRHPHRAGPAETHPRFGRVAADASEAQPSPCHGASA